MNKAPSLSCLLFSETTLAFTDGTTFPQARPDLSVAEVGCLAPRFLAHSVRDILVQGYFRVSVEDAFVQVAWLCGSRNSGRCFLESCPFHCSLGYLWGVRLFHVTDGKSLKNILKEGLVPAVGPRSQKCEDVRAVYFFKNRDFAFDAVCGWLGDCFPEASELFCLEVDLPSDFPIEEDPSFGGVESFTLHRVPPKYLVSRIPV